MNEGSGLWQIPEQLANCLVELSKYKINSFIEIGTCDGWTFSLITAYLQKFSPNLQAVTVDIVDLFKLYPAVRQLLPINYIIGKTSFDFKEQKFDLVFIDGDHSFDWVTTDYINIGSYSNICMFHDINDKNVDDYVPNNGGVRRFWEHLKYSEKDAIFREFLFHSEKDRVMGIGLRICV